MPEIKPLTTQEFFLTNFTAHQLPEVIEEHDENKWFLPTTAKNLSYVRDKTTGLLTLTATGADLCTISTDNCMSYIRRDKQQNNAWLPSNPSKSALRNYGFLFVTENAYYSIFKLITGRGKHVLLPDHPLGRIAAFLTVWDGSPFLALYWDNSKRQLDVTRARLTYDIRHFCINSTQKVTDVLDLSEFYEEIKKGGAK